MPRKPRQRSCTDYYHVIARGLNKLDIFRNRCEKSRILNLIRENCQEYDVQIYAYCIMSNHFHLLLKAELKELASFMARILAGYAQYYNYKYKRVGYVFQDRYKSQCIESEAYFWNCLKYIHLNPVKAGICKNIGNYNYSSVKEYYYPENKDKGIITEAAYQMNQKRFVNRKLFIDFHYMSDRNFFIDIAEEEFLQRKVIARDILWDMQHELKIPAIEILSYVKTRNLFEDRIRDLFDISGRMTKEIRKALETEVGQDK